MLENTKYDFLLQMDWINMDFGAPMLQFLSPGVLRELQLLLLGNQNRLLILSLALNTKRNLKLSCIILPRTVNCYSDYGGSSEGLLQLQKITISHQ